MLECVCIRVCIVRGTRFVCAFLYCQGYKICVCIFVLSGVQDLCVRVCIVRGTRFVCVYVCIVRGTRFVCVYVCIVRGTRFVCVYVYCQGYKIRTCVCLYCQGYKISTCVCLYCQGYKHRNAYIATQAPLENTIQDFWRMVWELNSHVVVLLGPMQEEIQVGVVDGWVWSSVLCCRFFFVFLHGSMMFVCLFSDPPSLLAGAGKCGG